MNKKAVMMEDAFASLRALLNPDKANSPLNARNTQTSHDASSQKAKGANKAANKKTGAKNASVALDVFIRTSSLD